MSSLDELNLFLESHPDLEILELLVPDMNGIIRGKRLDISEAETLFSKGINFPAATHLLDSSGNVIDGLVLGTDDGDPDVTAKPVANSLTSIPWLDKPAAQAMITMFNRNGEHYSNESRNILRDVINKFEADGFRATVAVELEFYLIQDKDALSINPRHGPLPGTILQDEGPQVYSMEDLRELDPFFNQLKEACKIQNIPTGTIISEFSRGQFETNLHHVDDPLLASDHAILLRRAVRETAKSFGLGATFMAKPFMETAGSGMHIHISLKNEKGDLLFQTDSKQETNYNQNVEHAVGGLAQTMEEGMAIFCPNANSYRRFQPGFFAPITPNWGPNHRNLSIRIPLSDSDNVRIEHRAAGADANPYLVMACVLAGIHYGLKNKITPPEMISEREVIDPEVTLPVKWDKALDAFENATILNEYLGNEYSDLFLRSRRCEMDRFTSQISNKDFEWYLRTI
ncbi:MAG TPA: glutamine synthetase [Gammaproteobacteria bacterium]|jgi:glutamine synthetase|nr:glutamine synthetase [Gammaproteobacteria bacterium]